MGYQPFEPGPNDKLTQFTWERSTLKNGKPGKRWELVVGNWYTPLRTCDLCGRTSTPRNICYRNDCYCWELLEGTPMLCVACWNKVRPIVYKFYELKDLKKGFKKLRRARREQK